MTVDELVTALTIEMNRRGVVVLPGPAGALPAGRWRSLTPAELAKSAPMRALCLRLGIGLRLIVIRFENGGTLLTACPDFAPNPPAEWVAATLEAMAGKRGESTSPAAQIEAGDAI